MVDNGLGGGVYPRQPPHTDEHVVDEVHWYKVCNPKLAVSADSQHSLPNLCEMRRDGEGGWGGGRRRGEEGGRREGKKREEGGNKWGRGKREAVK